MTTLRAPGHPIGHLTTPGYRAGNSLAGNALATRRGIAWVDNDGRWSKRDPITGKRTPINTHWRLLSREGFAHLGSRLTWGSLSAAAIARLRSRDGYRVRTMFEALDDAHARGQRVEWEIKEIASEAEIREVADHARSLWGDDWREYVVVKVLTTVVGWRRILRRAHRAGFTTIALVRGPRRYVRINSPSITYVRGASARVKYPKE
jgi:hypothetical protein